MTTAAPGTARRRPSRAAAGKAVYREAGTIDVVTALNTQTTLFTQLDLLTRVRLTRFQALVNLYKALGGGWTAPRP